ncbi:MAG: transglutaminase-like domain-containing protein [Candidatus Obscuribacterales bacterium]
MRSTALFLALSTTLSTTLTTTLRTAKGKAIGSALCRAIGMATGIAIGIAILVPLQALSINERLYGAVGTSDPKIYTVRTQTDLTIPTKGPSCSKVRVWHAIAAYKPWTQTASPLGASDLRCVPPAKIEAEDDKRSAHFYFEENRQFAPGTKLSYVTSFKTLSAKRTFNPSSFRCTWSDCQQYLIAHPQNQLANDPEVLALAVSLKQNHDPANTIIEFSKWLSKNITYDDTIQTRTDDLAATIKTRRGHCGHIAQLFHGLCRAVGIKSRDVLGLNLTDPNGKKTNLPNQWGNTHNWVEVHFPKIGWIEVEPIHGEKCYSIPAAFIQNNSSFQNAAVWVAELNIDKPVTWGFKDGRYQCDYNAITRITYSESKVQ